uniref:TFIIS N-terminal domain-containing protein n=1 Tax=Plectus sambesii TaxID=2011161 RepID=A0A914VLL3_9BILA
MLRKKKEENKKHRKRRRDGSIDLLSDADDQIKEMIEAMKSAAKEDRHSNTERKPALQKRKMLPFVKSQLRKADLAEALIDNGIMSVVSEWLAPLPDKSLPALEVRTELLKMLQQYNRLEQSVLRQSGLGKAVMLLYKHPRETKENKQAAARLISEWARPIFQLDTDFRALSREERVQRDYEHMPQAKKRRLSVEDGRQKSTDTPEDEEAPSRPGDKGWIGRARVPRPSTKDYVVRPKPNVEGQFRGESGGRKASSRYDRKMRELKDRTKSQKVLHAVGISLEGRKMP